MADATAGRTSAPAQGVATGVPTARRVADRVLSILPRRRDMASMGRDPRKDVIAGLTVAVVALPLALAFGVSSGLGAAAGLVTAVVAGVAAAIFGGSDLQVSGPTGAMAVVLVPIVAVDGPSGVLIVGLMAGIVLIGLALARAGRVMRYVPLPVVEGFTLGIALVIALQQVPAALGTHGTGEKVSVVAWTALRAWFSTPVWAPVLIAGTVTGAMLLVVRLKPGLPVGLPAVAVVSAVVVLTGIQVPTIGALPSGLPMPTLPYLDPARLSSLLLPAVAVAALAAMESLLSASVADALSVNSRHDPDRELFGQGIANLLSPLFGGMPATAAIARTAVNVRSGAVSRLSAMVHAVVLLAVVLVGSRLVAGVPLAALAGVLIATCVQMVSVSSVRALLGATRGDAAALLVTALATVAFDLITAVILGLAVSGLSALAALSQSARLDEIPLEGSDDEAAGTSLLAEHVVVYRLDGPLFFGAAHTFLLELSEVHDVRVVVLRMSRVHAIDATGAHVLTDVVERLKARGITVLLSGVRENHEILLRRLGVYDNLAMSKHVFPDTPGAIDHARIHVDRLAHQD